jgi:RNA polymerase sigma-70 factor (ECF subfamily)
MQIHCDSGELREQILEMMPALRAFARSLTSNRAEADDLIQDTFVKAWGNFGQFTQGTNLRAWLFTILRNTYYSSLRKRRRQVANLGAVIDASPTISAPHQEDSLAIKEMLDALRTLPAEQRNALILTGAVGMSYEETAEACGCALGTVKSRVNRGREKLLSVMRLDEPADMVGHDRMVMATGQ